MTRLRWLRGLRVRLMVAFVALTVIGAFAAAWAGSRAAAAALVDSTQQRMCEEITHRVDSTAAQLEFPPDRSSLERMRVEIGPDTMVSYRTLRSADGAGTRLITDQLREAVSSRQQVVTQRVVDQERPWLLIGMPVMITDPTGVRRPSGVEVYLVRDLSDVDNRVRTLARSVVGIVALTIPAAVILALLAANSVLRPVRRLRDTTRRLAVGDLAARSTPAGADELAELTVTINQMAESVQTSMLAMQRMQSDARRFAADVSHELRTPLSTLTAVMEVLQSAQEEMTADARESARLAITETHRLVRLVEDLMEVSRFDAGTAELHIESVDVPAVIRDGLRARGWLDAVELEVPDPQQPEEFVLELDRRRLDVIVANLVGNALRHGEPPVRVLVTTTEEQLQVEVTDAGSGLSAEVLGHVFDRFYKADAARSRSAGSGLGLAIARENAHLLGGELTASRGNQGGARFVLRLKRGSAS